MELYNPGTREQKAADRLLNKQIKEAERAIKKQENIINRQMKKEQAMIKKAIKKEEAARKKEERVNKYKPEKMVLGSDFVGPLMPLQKRRLSKGQKLIERTKKATERELNKIIKSVELEQKRAERQKTIAEKRAESIIKNQERMDKNLAATLRYEARIRQAANNPEF